jgi:hypothetical protein
MEITGRITEIYNTVTGISKSGSEWQKRDFVIETDDQFSKNICFTVFKHVDLLDGHREGEIVKVIFSVESREFNGKWYHNVNAFGISSIEKKEPEIPYSDPFIRNLNMDCPEYDSSKNKENIEDDDFNDLPF